MGNAWQRLQSKLHNKNVGVLLVGLDAAGKTTVLYQLKLGEVVTTIPTIGFNVETILYKNINFTAWDVAGRSGTRALYRHYYKTTDVVMVVVDSSDRQRLAEVKDEMWGMLAEEKLRSAIFLVMANKQDLPHAMSVQEVTEKLEMEKIKDREWYVQGTCATSGEGLYDGLNWLQATITQKEMKKSVVKPVKEVMDSVTPEAAPPAGKQQASKPSTRSWWSVFTDYFKTRS